MDAIVSYPLINSNATEAPSFYCKASNGTVVSQQSFGESPAENPADHEDKIMQAAFKAGNVGFTVSDSSPGHPKISGTNLSVSFNFQSVDSIEKTFAALSEDAEVTMPLQDAFRGAKFGMLTDDFGFDKMLNHDLKKVDKL